MVRYLFFIAIGALSLFGMDKSVTSTLQATQDIANLTQKIASDYLYLYYRSNSQKDSTILDDDIKKFENDIRFIAVQAKGDDIKNILDFLSYTKDEIKSLVSEDISKENAVRILDESNALVEALGSIVQTVGATPLESSIHFHILKLYKLYLAIGLKLDSEENRKLFYEEVAKIDKLIKKESINLQSSWKAYKDIINPSPLYFIPNIVEIMIEDLLHGTQHR